MIVYIIHLIRNQGWVLIGKELLKPVVHFSYPLIEIYKIIIIIFIVSRLEPGE
jgi:hypothetical protein